MILIKMDTYIYSGCSLYNAGDIRSRVILSHAISEMSVHVLHRGVVRMEIV